ncbi:unnamed protein product [Rotaria sp. Silwood2]|nr:unnamed protein product [Rotaria sp. Silwood2]
MTTTASTSSNLSDKDQIRVHVRRDGLIERQKFNGRVRRQLCKYDGGEGCQAFVADRNLYVGHYHKTSGITVNESKRRQLIQQLATAAVSSKATTMMPSKIRCSIETPLTVGLKSRLAMKNSTTEFAYEIEGDDTDYHSQGGPKRSRSIDKRQSLFENICFMIKCTENNEIKMTNDRLQDLITTCGGRIITCVTQGLLDQFEIVVLCDKLYVSERRHNYDQCRSLGIHFVSSDWVLESILEYRPKSFSLYEETPL